MSVGAMLIVTRWVLEVIDTWENLFPSHLAVTKAEEQTEDPDRGDFMTWPFPSPLLAGHPQCTVVAKTWHNHCPPDFLESCG